MTIKIQYNKLNAFNEKEFVKEGTIATGKVAKAAVKTAFRIFSLDEDACVEVNDMKFTWGDFLGQSVICTVGETEKTVPLKKAERMAVKAK